MSSLREEVERILASGRFTTAEAKQLLAFNWYDLARELPKPAQQEVVVVYLQIQGSIEEVEEGYVQDADYPEMRNRLAELLRYLPINAPTASSLDLDTASMCMRNPFPEESGQQFPKSRRDEHKST